jgi:hypothetical protein
MVDDARRPDEEVQDENPVVAHRISLIHGATGQPPSQTWRIFLRNHIGQIVAADFFVVPTAQGGSGSAGSPKAHRITCPRRTSQTPHGSTQW